MRPGGEGSPRVSSSPRETECAAGSTLLLRGHYHWLPTSPEPLPPPRLLLLPCDTSALLPRCSISEKSTD
eukprot:767487-Hanusia_phi.AAC.1